MPNNPHQWNAINARDIKTMAGCGVAQKYIALKIGIDETTLRKYYREELDLGKAEAIGIACRKLFEKVQEGNLTAIIFYLKTQAGWSEKLELADPDGVLQPRQIIKRIVVNNAEEVRQLTEAIAKAERGEIQAPANTH